MRPAQIAPHKIDYLKFPISAFGEYSPASADAASLGIPESVSSRTIFDLNDEYFTYASAYDGIIRKSIETMCSVIPAYKRALLIICSEPDRGD